MIYERLRFPAGQTPHDRGVILIVDDEIAIVEVLAAVLLEEGWDVVCAQNPPSCDSIRDLAPCLIVLDLMFGSEPAGVDLLLTLRQKSITAHIPILVCSAASRPQNIISKSCDLSRVEFLAKPFDLDDLLSGLERLIAGNSSNADHDCWAVRSPSDESRFLMHS